MARPLRVRLARRLLDEVRSGVLRVPDQDPAAFLVEELRRRAGALLAPGPHPVLNGTGVPLHTNLGRAPLGEAVREALGQAAGYTDLELDLGTGRRGDRNRAVGAMLALLCDTEAGLAVNNGAAAVLLAARALAADGEVLISRGELVEIGGSFRVPDVLRSAGATLVEVGTTNRTRASDYARALSPRTRMILRVHRSNFRIEGFTLEATRDELAALAREAGVPLVEDLGSGCFVPLAPHGLADEPTPEQVLSAGVDLVTFSGDKLLGGVQAGLVAGRAAVVQRLAKDPLLRALRLDKLMTAGVLASLAAYLRDQGPAARIPLHGMLARPLQELRADATRLAAALGELGAAAEVIETAAPVGGGSCPGEELPGVAVAFTHPDRRPDALARLLRCGRPALMLRIEDARLVLDPRALGGDLEGALEALRAALAPPGDLDPGSRVE